MPKKQPKPKRIPFRLIPRTPSPSPSDPYAVLDAVMAAYHPHLTGAKVVLAWREYPDPKPDQPVKLGKIALSPDIHRHQHDGDIIAYLNETAWFSALNDDQRRALLDHLLCHITVDLDDDEHPKEDATGRTVYKLRQPTVREFPEVVRRWGTWTQDIEELAGAVLEAQRRPLFKLAAGGE